MPPGILGGFPWSSWQRRSRRSHNKGACRWRTWGSNYTWTIVTVVDSATLLLALLHWLWVTGFDGDILTESLVRAIRAPPHLFPATLTLWPAVTEFEKKKIYSLAFCWSWKAGRVKMDRGEVDLQGPWERQIRLVSLKTVSVLMTSIYLPLFG